MKKQFVTILILMTMAVNINVSAQSSGTQSQTNSQTTSNNKKEKMKNITVKQEVKSSPEKIWNILRTGDDLDKWLPIIATCDLQGTGAGAKRVCTTPDGKTLKETILLVDDKNKIFKYKIDEQDMLPTKNYVGTVSIVEVNGKFEVHWNAQFEMTMEEAYPDVEKGLTDILKMAISSLDAAASK